MDVQECKVCREIYLEQVLLRVDDQAIKGRQGEWDVPLSFIDHGRCFGLHSADGHCQTPTGQNRGGYAKGFALYSLSPE